MANKHSVPDVEPKSQQDSGSDSFAAIELRILDADAKARENVNREASQRYHLRWLAVFLAFSVAGGMGWMLKHVVHHVLSLQAAGAPASFIIAIYVAPIVSITTVALALLVAAFRGFKESDDINSASLLSDGVKATGLIK